MGNPESGPIQNPEEPTEPNTPETDNQISSAISLGVPPEKARSMHRDDLTRAIVVLRRKNNQERERMKEQERLTRAEQIIKERGLKPGLLVSYQSNDPDEKGPYIISSVTKKLFITFKGKGGTFNADNIYPVPNRESESEGAQTITKKDL